MSVPFLVDAHTHTGEPGAFFAPQSRADELLALMDRLGIQRAISIHHRAIFAPATHSLAEDRQRFERSQGRIHYLGVFDPRCAQTCVTACREASAWPGFAGLKIHPSMHGVAADDEAYAPAWRLAAELGRPILTHTWSISGHNPVQYLSTPARFERWVKQFPSVRLVVGHVGGRGGGRSEAVRLARDYPNVYVDFAGDIFCYRLIEDLVAQVPVDKILFGSDFPWLDPRAHLTRVLLAEIPAEAKAKILGENARKVYGL